MAKHKAIFNSKGLRALDATQTPQHPAFHGIANSIHGLLTPQPSPLSQCFDANPTKNLDSDGSQLSNPSLDDDKVSNPLEELVSAVSSQSVTSTLSSISDGIHEAFRNAATQTDFKTASSSSASTSDSISATSSTSHLSSNSEDCEITSAERFAESQHLNPLSETDAAVCDLDGLPIVKDISGFLKDRARVVIDKDRQWARGTHEEHIRRKRRAARDDGSDLDVRKVKRSKQIHPSEEPVGSSLSRSDESDTEEMHDDGRLLVPQAPQTGNAEPAPDDEVPDVLKQMALDVHDIKDMMSAMLPHLMEMGEAARATNMENQRKQAFAADHPVLAKITRLFFTLLPIIKASGEVSKVWGKLCIWLQGTPRES